MQAAKPIENFTNGTKHTTVFLLHVVVYGVWNDHCARGFGDIIYGRLRKTAKRARMKTSDREKIPEPRWNQACMYVQDIRSIVRTRTHKSIVRVVYARIYATRSVRTQLILLKDNLRSYWLADLDS